MYSAYDVITRIVQSNTNIESLTLVTYVEGSNWRDLRRENEHPSLVLLMRGLDQDQGERILTKISRERVSTRNLSDVAGGLSNDELLGIASKVRLIGGRIAHIPMMDFMCTPSEANLGLLAQLLAAAHRGPGFLLESGRSYHYYGFQLLTEEEWKVFLGKCLLMSGFADDRYIGHQLVDGYCVLRLSSRKSMGSAPRVVAELS